MTIYLITQGEYSDYSVKGVFDNKELAEAFIAKFSQADYRIEEYELNALAGRLNNPLTPFRVAMSQEGEVISITDGADIEDGEPRVNFSFDYSHKRELLYVFCWANDSEHAIKIANEKRLQLIAANRWGWAAYIGIKQKD